jgi:hypothetical protein
MRKITAIETMRHRFLSPALVETCRFARCQLQDTPRWYNVGHSADGVWNGTPVYFDFILRPLFADYAVAIYRQVLADALAYYPDFMRCGISDGPLVGERRLVFPDRLDEAAAYWMQTRALYLMERSDIAVPESCTVTVDPNSTRVGNRIKAQVHLVLDRPETTVETRNEVAAAMSSGQAFPVDLKPRKCDPRASLDMFTELSLPELVLLNWPQVQKKPRAVDQLLHKAVEKFDYDGVRNALAAGADPNCLPDEQYPQCALTTVASYKHWMRQPSNGNDWDELRRRFPGPSAEEIIRMIDLLVDAGAALDWAAPNELTPLAEASLNSDAAVVSHLTELGADPSIRCHSDEYPSELGTAWEFADYRCNPHADNDDDSAWNALSAAWPEPYGGFGGPADGDTAGSKK